MKIWFLFLVISDLKFFFVNAEYKLCATFENESLCKWIEASRSEIICVRVSDSVDCLLKMQKNEADFGSFSAEEAFLVGHFLGDEALVLAEVRHPERADRKFGFETVAVVRSNFNGGLSALKGLSYCHPGFSKAQYWSDRVLKDFEIKVEGHFKNEIKYNSARGSAYEDDLYRLSMIFSKACRPGHWAVNDWWDKKLKREYHSLCAQCEHPSTCTYKVQNKGKHSEALRCLTLHGGNVTYTALEFVQEYFDLNTNETFLGPDHKNPSHYNFLCPDGSTRPLTSVDSCSWIKQPWTSVIALNSVHSELMRDLREWLYQDDEMESRRSTWTDHLRKLLVKNQGVLRFRDRPLTVTSYIKEGRNIPKPEKESHHRVIRWCTISKTEQKKCEYISVASLIHGLPTQIECVPGTTKIDCLKKIKISEADVVFIDSELGFISRKIYNLTAGAYLETQRKGNYYGVIVTKGNSIKQIKDLQGKRACFPQYNGLGWLTFVEALKISSIIPKTSCASSKNIWNFFSKTCAPGAMDSSLNLQFSEVPERLCKGCMSNNAGSSCDATTGNSYFGEIGALRCLNNQDGDVAFLNFYTIREFLGSNRQNTGDSKINSEDFKILCKDGSVGDFNLVNPDKCSYIQINGGEVVTRNNLELVERNDVFHTLLELDDLFGTTSRHYNPAIKMFEPFEGESNVLFKDSAVSLVSTFETQNNFVNNYVKLLNNLENCLGENASSIPTPSGFVLGFFIIFLILTVYK